MHIPFGKCDFDEDKLTDNLLALSATIDKARPSGAKGKMWKTAAITATMGPSIKLDLGMLKDASAAVAAD